MGNNMMMNKDYNRGFHDGTKFGARMAKKKVAVEFVNRLQTLRNTKGIGPKTWDKIMDCLDINKEEVNERYSKGDAPTHEGDL